MMFSFFFSFWRFTLNCWNVYWCSPCSLALKLVKSHFYVKHPDNSAPKQTFISLPSFFLPFVRVVAWAQGEDAHQYTLGQPMKIWKLSSLTLPDVTSLKVRFGLFCERIVRRGFFRRCCLLPEYGVRFVHLQAQLVRQPFVQLSPATSQHFHSQWQVNIYMNSRMLYREYRSHWMIRTFCNLRGSVNPSHLFEVFHCVT